MAHRSVPRPDPVDDAEVDPFWQDAFRQRPPLLERLTSFGGPLRSAVVAAVGVRGVLGVGWWLLRPGAAPVETTLPVAEAGAPAGEASVATSGSAPTGSTTSTTAAALVVQAAGAVGKPGVYELPAGARVDDLVEAAGGLTKRADGDRVNLAAPVADGERVWIPAQGEDAVPDVVAGTGGGTSSGSGGSAGGAGGGSTSAGGTGGGVTAPAGPVDLNTATAEQLDSLPGVGPATATAILAYREEHGRFGSVEELLEVRGIGDAKLEQLRPLVRV